TVAAGGGSICTLRDGRVRVGPESAGADPGPACYGAGGPLTLTDVNLLLGRLDADRFGIPLDLAAARRRLEELLAGLAELGQTPAEETLLGGLLEIADERMAEAIRAISVRRGYDPRDHALVAFGGAGAQHACAVAELLGVGAVVVPEDAALLSARGLRSAVVERFAERQVLAELEAVADCLDGWLDELAARAVAEVEAQGVVMARVRRRLAFLRFAGQESTLEVAIEPGRSLRDAFETAYLEIYGYRPESRAVELESLRVVASSQPEAPAPMLPVVEHDAPEAGGRRVWLAGAWQELPTYDREILEPGARFAGPALVFERHSSTVVGAGWRGRVDGARALVLEPAAAPAAGGETDAS
ncbi:MAG: 5-oxoprolinase, partial [Acidobacteria bacterium]|nr:5-oxoprolinase [Acidobacteriota bacterium]